MADRQHLTRWFLALALAVASSCGGRRNQLENRPLTPVQVAERAKPATVMIATRFEGTWQSPKLTVDTSKLVEAARERLGSNTEPSIEDVFKAIFNSLYDRPELYIVERGEPQTKHSSVTSLGTGFIVTPDGYVLTNAHVVTTEDIELKKVIISSIYDSAEQDKSDMREMLDQLLPGSTPTKDAEDRLREAIFERYLQSSSLSNKSSSIQAFMVDEMGSDGEPRRMECDVKKVGSPIPGKDVAILKIQGNDLPTLPLAENLESGGMQSGADLYVLGYPGAISVDKEFSLRSRLSPSWTAGHVSGIKEMNGGWQVIQTDAAINQGNSGGPALNLKGEVVGLATFKVAGDRNDPPVEGVNFAVSIELGREFLRELNIAPKESAFTAKYVEALDAYESNQHDEALALYRELSTSHPESVVVREFGKKLAVSSETEPSREGSASAQAESPDSHSSSISPIFFLAVLGGLMAVVVTIIVIANRN